MKRLHLCLLIVTLTLTRVAAQAPIDISTKSDNPREAQAREQLLRIVKTHDLSKWIVTRSVVIEQGVRQHSHPVLTLNTRYLDKDDQQMSAFVHEQMHWHLAGRNDRTNKAIRELAKKYKDVPVGLPDGADSVHSTYLHLLVNYLELTAMKEILGDAAGRALIEAQAKDGYRWIYQTVLADEAAIGMIAAKNKLLVP